MIVDLHNHTPLCNHAKGSIDEYIKAAIKAKTKYFGFSDHAPMEFDKDYRMSFDDMGIYELEVLRAKEEYKDQIEILLGYEVDFMPSYMDERVLKADVDYLIGSVHFLGDWGFDNPQFLAEYKNRDIDEIYKEYFKEIELLAKSGKFDIVGHLDLIRVMGFRSKTDVRVLAKDAIKAIKKADMTVELSSAGFRKPIKEAYPSSSLMELLSEYDIPITFASDAHHPKQVGFKSEDLYLLAKSYGYKKCALFKNRNRELINF